MSGMHDIVNCPKAILVLRRSKVTFKVTLTSDPKLPYRVCVPTLAFPNPAPGLITLSW